MAASKYATVKADVEGLLNGLGCFLTEITDGSGSNGPSALLAQQLSKNFEAYYTLKRRLENDTIDCAMMALTKSGKSTVLNALTGATILPSNNVPETARIVSIEQTPLGPHQKPFLTYRAGKELIRVEGEDQIYAHLEYCNREVRSRQHRKEDELPLEININIAALPREACQENCRLRILDTPGTNEAEEARLRHSVERLLDSVDAVVYILDYTKLKTTEEATVLAKLKDANPQLVHRLAQRLFFVVNKIDNMQTAKGLQEEELCDYVADVITKQMNSEAFQLRPDQVLLVSAQEALLARLVLLDKATQAEQNQFGLKVWGSNYTRSRRPKSKAEFKEEAAIMLEESRFPELENRLFSYLYNNAGGLRLVAMLDNISRLLNEIQNGAMTGMAALNHTASQLQKESIELQAKLDDTLAKFDSVQNDADQIEIEVVENVRARMQTLKERLFDHVTEVLECDREPQLPAASKGWRNTWEKAVRFLKRENESPTDSQLQERLQELHEDIHSQISTEIQQFWHDLEVATNEKHQQLISVLNQHLDNLARVVEKVVGGTLNLKLEPVIISLEPPTAQQFHNSVEKLFAAGINRSTTLKVEQSEEEYVVWEKRYRGLCNSSEYYVGSPATRTVEVEKEVVTFELEPEKVKEYFKNLVNDTVETSVKSVRAYVHHYLADKIETARARISAYGKSYASVMRGAVEMKSRSQEEQGAGIAALRHHLNTVSQLLARCSDLQQNGEQLIQAAELPGGWVLESHNVELQEPLAKEVESSHGPDFQLEVEDHLMIPESAEVSSSSAEDSYNTATSEAIETRKGTTAEDQMPAGEDLNRDQYIGKAEVIDLTKEEIEDLTGDDQAASSELEVSSTQQPKKDLLLPIELDPSPERSIKGTEDEAEVGRTANEAQDLSAHSLLTMLEGLSSTESVLPLSRHVDSLDPFTVYSADSLLPSGSLQDVAILPSGAHGSRSASGDQRPIMARSISLDSSEWECLSQQLSSPEAPRQ